MLLGLFVVSILGGVLHEQISSGLENDRVATAEYESLNLTSQAQNRWDNSTSTSVDDLDQAARDIMSGILAEPGPQPSRYVVMNRSAGNDSDVVLASLTQRCPRHRVREPGAPGAPSRHPRSASRPR